MVADLLRQDVAIPISKIKNGKGGKYESKYETFSTSFNDYGDGQPDAYCSSTSEC